MIQVTDFAAGSQVIDDVLSLPYELRQKSRLKTKLQSGEEAGLMLPRGTVLRGGDCLLSEDGRVIQIQAQPEKTSRIISDNLTLLQRAAYHLGNRHVALEITENGLRYLQDHVLDNMIQQLGLQVIHEISPFEPEPGAYGHHEHKGK